MTCQKKIGKIILQTWQLFELFHVNSNNNLTAQSLSRSQSPWHNDKGKASGGFPSSPATWSDGIDASVGLLVGTSVGAYSFLLLFDNSLVSDLQEKLKIECCIS